MEIHRRHDASRRRYQTSSPLSVHERHLLGNSASFMSSGGRASSSSANSGRFPSNSTATSGGASRRGDNEENEDPIDLTSQRNGKIKSALDHLANYVMTDGYSQINCHNILYLLHVFSFFTGSETQFSHSPESEFVEVSSQNNSTASSSLYSDPMPLFRHGRRQTGHLRVRNRRPNEATEVLVQNERPTREANSRYVRKIGLRTLALRVFNKWAFLFHASDFKTWPRLDFGTSVVSSAPVKIW